MHCYSRTLFILGGRQAGDVAARQLSEELLNIARPIDTQIDSRNLKFRPIVVFLIYRPKYYPETSWGGIWYCSYTLIGTARPWCWKVLKPGQYAMLGRASEHVHAAFVECFPKRFLQPDPSTRPSPLHRWCCSQEKMGSPTGIDRALYDNSKCWIKANFVILHSNYRARYFRNTKVSTMTASIPPRYSNWL